MTIIYLADCSPIMSENIIDELLPRFSVDRQTKIRRYIRIENKAQSAATGLLLNSLLGGSLLSRDDNGKPHLPNDDRYISISHSDKWVALAISQCEIGLDIQLLSPIRRKVLSRCFSVAEQDYVGNDSARFTQLWTNKEAYGKYTGLGYKAPFDAPIPDIPHCDGVYEDIRYSLYGDNDARLSVINIKDLL